LPCCPGKAKRKHYNFLKLHVEFDETQQEQGVNFGLVRNKAAFPVLVPLPMPGVQTVTH
jgi:hypothetical protein